MNVLLLYPEFPDTFWSFKHALEVHPQARARSPPLGLLTVAAMLPADWGKRLVDLNVRRADGQGPGVGRLRVRQRDDRAARLRAGADRALPGGGQDGRGRRAALHAEHEHFPEVDHFVLNEAEVTLPPFLRDFGPGARPARLHLDRVRRHRADARAAVGAGRPEPLRLDEHPVLARLPVRLRVLQRHRAVRPPAAHQDARRRSSPSWTASTRLGWRGSVFFVDDNFIGNKRRLKTELLPALIEWQQRQARDPVLHRGLDQPGRRRGADAA